MSKDTPEYESISKKVMIPKGASETFPLFTDEDPSEVTYAKPSFFISEHPKSPNFGKPLFIVDYGVKGYGFGSFSFYTDADGKIRCDNECSSKEIITLVMSKVIADMGFDD